jgi:AcrR family transcriptional regulator
MSAEAQAARPSARREEILLAAAEIFWEKGYHGTSMRDVAEATNMRKASLYHHVRNKETLLIEMSVSSLEHIIEGAESIVADDPECRLRALVEHHVTALIDDRSRHATMLVELRSLAPDQRRIVTDLRSRYDRIFDEAIADVQQATGRWPDVPTRLVRLSVLGVLNWTVFWFSPEGPDSAAAVAATFTDLILSPAPLICTTEVP